MSDIEMQKVEKMNSIEEIYVNTDNEEEEITIEKSLLGHQEKDVDVIKLEEESEEGEEYTNQTNPRAPNMIKGAKKKTKKNSARFDCRFICRFCNLFFTKLGVISCVQLLIFLCMVIIALVNSGVGFIQMKFYTKVLSAISSQRFVEAWGFLCIRTVAALVGFVCELFLKNGLLDYWLFYLWRKNLTRNILKRYFSNKNYYVILNMKEDSVDNPDQRIQSDAKDFCLNLSLLLCQLVYLSTDILVNFFFMLSTGAFWLFIPIVLYPIISSVGYLCFFTPVSKNIFQKDSLEGDFRFAHTRIRENAESISFFKSEESEENYVASIFKKLRKSLMKLSVKMFLLTIWTTLGFFIPSVTFIFVLVMFSFANIKPYYEGMDAESLVNTTIDSYQAAMALSQTINSILALGQFLGIVIGNATRISEMFEQMNKIEKEEKRLKRMRVSVKEDKDAIKFDGVQVQTPMTKKVLFDNLNFSIHEGEHLLIMGPSGVGKTSILRALSGLWEVEKGVISRPMRIGQGGIFFLPQRPYILRKSLMENIIYPLTLEDVPNITDEELFSVLDLANITSVLKMGSLRDENICWDEKLSLGEQQRLQMSRLFFNRPKFAILDECTSALDPENEETVYINAQTCGITCISIAHRRTVQKYHDYLLRIVEGGEVGNGSSQYQIEKIDKTTIPTYEYEWTVLNSHEVTRAQEIQGMYETMNDSKKDIEHTDKHLGSTGLNYTFFKRSCRLCCCGILVRPWTMWIYVVITLIVQFASALAPILLFQGSGAILTAMVDRNLFLSIAYSLIIIFGIFVAAFGSGLAFLFIMVQGVCCRANLTKYLQKRYFRNQIYYEVNVLDKEIDNPDQRICNDSDLMTSGFAWNPGFSFVQFSFVTSVIAILLSLVMSALLVSVWLPIYALVCYIVMGVIQLCFTLCISRLRFLQQKREGFFRYSLTRMKENSEQIAFLNGKELEREIIEKKFDSVLDSQFWLYFVTAVNNSFSSLIGGMVGSATFVIILFSIYSGSLDLEGLSSGEILGKVQSLSNMFNSVVLSFLLALMTLITLGSTIGTVGRVGQFIEKMDKVDKRKKKELKMLGDGTPKSRRVDVIDWIGVQKLNGETPTKKSLFHNLNFEAKIGDSTIIRGPSGCGKSSLLRMISGLWEVNPKDTNCRIYAPKKVGKDGLYFLPQKPYISPGSLFRQVIYPDDEIREGVTMNDLEIILNEVNLGYILTRVGGWNTTKNEWSNILSPGETQRIGVARLLYHKPTFAVLDESTSSLDEENENLVYDLCQRNNITPISVGHRLSLLSKHSHVLEFDGNGGWVWKKKGSDENLGSSRSVERSHVRDSIKRKSLDYRKSLKSRSNDAKLQLQKYDEYRKSISVGRIYNRNQHSNNNNNVDDDADDNSNGFQEEEIRIEVIGEEERELMDQTGVVYYPQSKYDF